MYKLTDDSSLRKIKEQLQLTDLDIFLIIEWFNNAPHVGDYPMDTEFMRLVEYNADERAKTKMRRLIQKNIWEKGSLNFLNAIADQTPINIGFFGDQMEVLPKEMLERLSSLTEVRQSDPRASIAKKLGAKIII